MESHPSVTLLFRALQREVAGLTAFPHSRHFDLIAADRTFEYDLCIAACGGERNLVAFDLYVLQFTSPCGLLIGCLTLPYRPRS